MKQRVTLKKIAKEFGVSISTVSKALKGSHEIGKELREKIKAYAAFYNYKPNGLALNLRNQKTKTIGVIIPEIIHHFFSEVINGIEQFANKKGYNVMICLSNESFEKEVLNLEMLANGVVDGIIVSIAKETAEIDDYTHFQKLVQDEIPLVLFDRVTDKVKCNKVLTDDFGGGYQATQHLIDIGCRRIAILTTPDHVSVGENRTRGYIKALWDAHLEMDKSWIIKINEKQDIETQIKRFFDLKPLPDAVFAVNEIYAATLLKLAHEKEIKVPDELAIVGYTNGFISEFTSPPMTTVIQHGQNLGKRAAEMLLEEIDYNKPDYTHRTEVIKTDLFQRKSTEKMMKKIL